MKHPQPMTLELAIRALEHERRAHVPPRAETQWQAGYDAGYVMGLERALQVLRDLNVANRQPGEDPFS